MKITRESIITCQRKTKSHTLLWVNSNNTRIITLQQIPLYISRYALYTKAGMPLLGGSLTESGCKAWPVAWRERKRRKRNKDIFCSQNVASRMRPTESQPNMLKNPATVRQSLEADEAVFPLPMPNKGILSPKSESDPNWRQEWRCSIYQC